MSDQQKAFSPPLPPTSPDPLPPPSPEPMLPPSGSWFTGTTETKEEITVSVTRFWLSFLGAILLGWFIAISSFLIGFAVAGAL